MTLQHCEEEHLTMCCKHVIDQENERTSQKKSPSVKVAEFPNTYETQLPITSTKKRRLDAMARFLLPEFVPFYQQLKAEIDNITGQAPAVQQCTIQVSIFIILYDTDLLSIKLSMTIIL
uniref:Uncharacterized protein n=1 Tax=Cuerna arida TaxID=1464854 RepID=A0A1B6GTM2_9HEMI